MSNAPLVAVIIPAWNAQDRIGEAVATAAMQTWRPLEIIVVDDASNDATVAAAKAAIMKYDIPCRIIEGSNNQGPSAARNSGWKSTTAQWIQFLDDDDTISPGKIEWQVSCAEHCSSEAAIIYSKWAIQEIGDKNYVIREPFISNESKAKSLADLMEDSNFIPIASGIVSRSWLERIGGFDESIRLIEDVQLQIRIIADGGKFVNAASATPLFTYQRRAGSLSRSHRDEYLDGLLRNARLAWEVCDNCGEDAAVILPAMREAFAQAIVTFAESDREKFDLLFEEAKPYFKNCHRRGSRAFTLLVQTVGWRNAELAAAYIRKARGIFHRDHVTR